MKGNNSIAISITLPVKTQIFPSAGLALLIFLAGHSQPGLAQTLKSDNPADTRAWAPAAIEHAEKMRMFKDADIGSQPTLGVIPKFSVWDARDLPAGRPHFYAI